jgi:osmotically-inducible protein OsmY
MSNSSPTPNEATVKAIMADLERDTRVNLHAYPIRVGVKDDGVLVLEGTVENIAAKRIAHHAAHRHAGNAPVLDRLRVEAPESESTGQLRDEVVNLLQEEPVFRECGLYVREGDRLDALRVSQNNEWGEQRIEIEVNDGAVTLTGRVLSLTHRRLAEVLAWWAAGCEIVENFLHVVPPELETDDELVDAVRMVMEKDPLVRADQLLITAQQGVVTLGGFVASEDERQLAVQDAWYVLGVRDVVDNLTVGA